MTLRTYHFAYVFHGDGGDRISGDFPSQILLHSGDQERGEGVGGLTEDMADEALRDIATDGKTEGLLGGDGDEE